MRAVVIERPGDADVLSVQEVPAPQPTGAEVLVRVVGAGLNRADLLQRRGLYPPPHGVDPRIPGLEYAGLVDQTGPQARLRQKGERVMGLVGGATYAEWVVVHERETIRVPQGLDLLQAAALPEVFLTAHDALETQAGVRPGERVLIHDVGGGVGSAAVQIAHAMGCTVFGTSRTEEKLRRAAGLGLDVGIESGREDFAVVVRDRTAGAGVHAVIAESFGTAV